MRSAVILAGGSSKRFGEDKGLVKLADKPLTKYVIEAASKIVDDVVVVLHYSAQVEEFKKLFPDTRVVIDGGEEQGPLVGALTGFECVQGDYSLLLPCDTPFISLKICSLLLDLCEGKIAVIPRWPNGFIEPLQAAYHKDSAISAAREALNQKKLDFQSMIKNLRGIRYISTLFLKKIDSDLLTFFNVNTPSDLKKAHSILHSRFFQRHG